MPLPALYIRHSLPTHLTRTPSCPLDRYDDEDSDNLCASAGDECPTDPDKLSPGPCGCNVKEVHSDDDGIPDCIVRLMLSQYSNRCNHIPAVQKSKVTRTMC